jgi:phage terminase large subunit-like protein
MTLSLVHPPPRPKVRAPHGPWREWFRQEVAPLRSPAVHTSPEYRRRVTRGSALRFAIVYLDHHLVLQGVTPPTVTFNEMHLALSRASRRWIQPARWREAWIGPRGVGKALALDTPVLTIDRGWTTHGDLRVGDRVFDERGQPCNVVRVSQRWANRPCYRVTFSDGEQIVADENHEWYVNDRYSDLEERIEDTARISEKWLLSGARGWREVRYSVPVAGPLQYPEAALPIAPYVLGAWLGDGTSSAGAITVGRQDVEHLVEQLRTEGENPIVRRSGTAWTVQLGKPRPHLCPREHTLEPPNPGRPGSSRPCRTCIAEFQWHGYRGSSIGPRTNRPLIARLRDENLLGNKHIPERYLTASVEQRLALLQGLMDTDGTIGTRGTCEFSVTNERLAHDALRLVQSLGIKARIKQSRATIGGVDKGPRWRVTFHTEQPVFRLPRKLQRVPATIRAAGNRRIVNVERVENQTTSCVEVDSPWHLYLVGRSLVPTHNSSWCFLALPLWALAHGHRQYFMAFSHTGKMAEKQLSTLRMELETNTLLRQDYPELAPRRIRGASNTNRTVVANGGTIAAAGLKENTLGAKSGANRPDLIILDDIEPLEEVLPEAEKRKIETAIKAAVIPMSAPHAAIGIFGTTTSYDSVMDRVARHGRGRARVGWVENNEFTVRLFPGVQIDPDTGEERSLWPERWPLTDTHLGEHLRRTEEGETPREFELNYLLDPSPFGEDAGSFWRTEMFKRRTSASFGGVFEHMLYIDTAVTAKATSDRTALVIVGRDTARRNAVVEYAWAGRISAEQLRQRIHRLAARKPSLRTVKVEANQGGDLWREMLDPAHDRLPRQLKLHTDFSSNSKQARVEQALAWYERGQVFHAKEFVELEREMVMFPSPKINDDLVDALTGALRWALASKQ